jgi:hypothetical protein
MATFATSLASLTDAYMSESPDKRDVAMRHFTEEGQLDCENQGKVNDYMNVESNASFFLAQDDECKSNFISIPDLTLDQKRRCFQGVYGCKDSSHLGIVVRNSENDK